ncbi:thrombospondin type-1 domain-containing protein 7A isoform X3 [Rhineura floridana]|uniref:thrombospondin type-1 domain-containing protein 7A isoform X3 n=1 Tax=Rhineura floridana TaxID=261503 RepID=UPI002AC882C0|nr:thrombospondin type-1 domain-containing protein 7A isoform X3 [Rhineura floridana]
MGLREKSTALFHGPGVSVSSECIGVLVLLLFGIWGAKTQSEFETSSVYLWKPGPWGRCMGDECGPGGIQTRAILCTHVEGWTTLITNCKQAERPDNQQNCFRVCDRHKELYDWQLGDWNQCQPVLSRSFEKAAECFRGEEGIQRRDVTCVQKSNGIVAEDTICEYFEQKPQLEQGCLIPCRQDCIVSEFSAWSECSKSCGKGMTHRFRHVVAPPQYGGSACANLTEFQVCSSSPCTTEESIYSLNVGPWSPCSVPHTRHIRQARKRGKNKEKEKDKEKAIRDPEARELLKKKRNRNRQNRQENKYWDIQIGYQTRQVMCTHRNGKTVALSFCQQEKLPITFQSCVITKECQVSEWSEWSPCSKTCFDMMSPKGNRTRTRTIKQFPIGSENECPELEETEQCASQGDGVAPCITYGWRTTEWTECRIDPLLSQQDKRRGNQTALCGGGIQTREVYCVQANENLLSYLNTLKEKEESQSQSTSRASAAPLLSITFEITASKPVDWKLCTGLTPSTTQLCYIPCPIECEVSGWSAWGPCTFESCDDQQAKKGFKLRKRRIANEPTGGTGNCPHLLEAIPCEEPSCYDWRIVRLEECIPDNEKECGPGTQVPQVICISSDGEEVDRQLCRDAIYPVPIVCEVPCPKDCVLSTWSGWSSCSHTCSGKTTEGKQMRARSILAYAGEGGIQCPNNSMLQETRNCNEHPCTVYHWQTGPWGQCIEDVSVSAFNSSTSWNGEATCAVGMQTRKVMCVRVNVGQVGPKKCPESLRPETVRPCLLPCRKDCIVTPYSDWTPCPSSCQEGDVKVTKQSRHRVILQLPANGGRDCPDTLYEEKDCELPPACLYFRWKTHKWRRCQLVPWYVRQDSPGAQETCGPGLQARAITCRKQDGGQADISECLKYAGALPSLTQPCQIPCQDDCQFTSWSKFSSCNGDCGAFRTRKRSLTGKSKKKEKCKNSQLYPLIETQICPCDKYNAQPVGNWSDCILPEGKVDVLLGMKVQGDIKECGQGYRYQAMACYDQNSRLVETSRCNSHGYIEEACIIPCPSDCKLSEWSNWSRCSKSCGSGVKVRSKWLREKPYNGGRPCPKLDHVNQVYEVVPCHSDCSQYIGVPEPWSVCKVTNVDLNENCGEGVQTRKVRCMQNTMDGPSDTVEDYLCDQEEMPIGARKCTLPCPEDCVMSEWGQWSRCSLPCNGSNVRERSAEVMRQPQGGKACPASVETEPCSLNKNCFHYDYNVTDWSTCQLSEKAVCGNGIKTRMLDCVRSDGKSVDLKYCEKLGLEKTWQMNTSCVVECPVNCQLSDWSPWSECSQACGLSGKMIRRRTIIQPFQGDGRPCPSQMEQFKPCPVKPCYCWQYSQWAECKVEDAQCGEGTRVRNISCVVYDGSSDDAGKIVDEEFCGEIEPVVDGNKKMVLEETCTLPCPGDCYLKEWSEWSLCQLTCVNGEDLGFGGIQVRSRAVIIQDLDNQHLCPEQVLETRQCNDGQCYEYKWMASPWKGSSRTVWCQRSDGLNVTDGKLKTWVYGVAAGAFVLLIFVISMIYLACKKPKKPQRRQNNRLKPLTLAYDGDADM